MEIIKDERLFIQKQTVIHKHELFHSKKDICRLCLCTSTEFGIFNDFLTVSKIEFCCDLELFENDGLPDHICKSCYETLGILFQFKNKSKESDAILRNKIKIPDVNIKMTKETKIHYFKTNNQQVINETESIVDEDTNDCNAEISLRDQHITTDSDFELSDHYEKLFVPNFTINKTKPIPPENRLCYFCGKLFKRGRFSHHLNIHKRSVAYTCHICAKVLLSPSGLKLHMQVHSSVRNHPCEFCGKRFKSVSHLNTHMGIVHKRINAVNCHICHKELSSRKSLKLHLKRHTGEIRFDGNQNGYTKANPYNPDVKIFSCVDCSKIFKNPLSLKNHTNRVHKKVYASHCYICNKELGTRFSLKMHLLVHRGERKYECDFCNRKFLSKLYLKTHIRVHSGEKPYTCKFCEKSFAINSTLRGHERLHTGETPYSCSFCPKKFTQRYLKCSHIIKRHKEAQFSN